MRRGDWLVAGGGLALFVFLFFVDWFGGSLSGLLPGSHISGATVDTTGWETFTSSRWLWLATILAALVSTLATATAYRFEGPIQPGAVVAGLGALSSALIVYRIVHHPSARLDVGNFHASYGIKIGIWLGLIAALAITAGGCLQVESAPAAPVVAPEQPGEAFSGLTVAPGEAPDESPPSSRPPGEAP